MNLLLRGARAFVAFWVDLVIGDDWRIAAGVMLSLAGTALLAHAAHLHAWWLLPPVVLGVLALSVARAARTTRAANSAHTAHTAREPSSH
ncbi:MAG TPA: hypothetical protein VMU89_21185 [Thermomicrobiaceae bacterium]|nr:hypothetical protein [Thermomicrobiaceae bacterium]